MSRALLLAVLLAACSGGKDDTDDTRSTDDTGVVDDTAPPEDTAPEEETCTGLDLEYSVIVLDETGAPCEPCDATQRLRVAASLHNPCETDVGIRFISDCTVSRLWVSDADGEEAWSEDLTCVEVDRLFTMDAGDTVEEEAATTFKVAAGSYVAGAQFDDVGEREAELFFTAE